MRVPEITDPVKFEQALAEEARHRFVLDEASGSPPLLSAGPILRGDSLAVFIGPEGGWIDNERSCLAASGWKSASLGPLILRAETAACAALAVVTQMFLVANATE